MAQRFSRFLTMAALGGLVLCSAVSPHKAGATGGLAIAATMAGTENKTSKAQVSASPTATKSGPAKKPRSTTRKKDRAPSRFVRLGQRLVDDSLVCRDEFEDTGTSVDPVINRCLTNDRALQWAFGSGKDTPIGFADHPFIDVELPDSQHMIIQPLHLHLGRFTPLFNQYFTPGGKRRYLSVSDQSLSDDRWFLDQVAPLADPDRIISDQPPASGPGQERSPFAYSYSVDRKTSLIAGVGWISDIGDTTGMSQAFAQAGYEAAADTMSAVNVTLGARYSDFTLIGGYIRAIEDKNDEFMAHDQATDPMAWCSELAYNTTFFSQPAALAVGYQKSSEALSPFLPEERYTTKASILLRDSTRLSLEYYRDHEDASDHGINGEDGYGITTKLGFQF